MEACHHGSDERMTSHSCKYRSLVAHLVEMGVSGVRSKILLQLTYMLDLLKLDYYWVRGEH